MSDHTPSPNIPIEQEDTDDIVALAYAGPAWRLIQRWNASLYFQSFDHGVTDITRFIFGKRWTTGWRRALDPYIHKRELYTRRKVDVKHPPTDLRDSLYPSLPSSSHIRLVHILAGARDAPLEISFSVVNLSEAPHFETLSYVWGEKRHYRIICDGASIIVRENLFNALHALRSPDEARIFWIDALCINQADPRERAQQQARRSFPGSADIANVFSDNTVFTELGSLYANPWFYRVWIIQEVVVAHNVFVLLGEDNIWAWDTFAQASRVALNHCKLWQVVFDPKSAIWLDQIRQQHLTDGPRPTLLQALVYGRNALATLEVDKVYAMLGLTKETFHVDYEESSTATFIRLAAHIVTCPGGLAILGFVEDHCFRLNTKLPSWVPDWEVRHGPQPFYAAHEYLTWNASFGTEPFVQLDTDDRCLHVQGVVVDEVVHLGNSFLEEPPVSGGTRRIAHSGLQERFLRRRKPYLQLFALRRVQQWRYLALKHAAMYQDEEERHDAYLYTLVAGQVTIDAQSLTFLRRSYSLWCRVWLDAASNDLTMALSAYEKLSSQELAEALPFIQMHVNAAWGRRFFTSRRRGIIGLCPFLARKGDLLAVIHGSNIPCILRRIRNGKYRFVGQCYAHGLMYGEAKDLEDLPARQEIQIV